MENSDGVVFYKHGTDPIIAEQAEQITALKEKNCELAHKIGHMTDDINEQERHTE